MTASTMLPPAEPPSPLPLDKVTVRLTGEQETLLVPLMARAHDAQRAQPLLNDAHAGRTLARVDHDLAKFGAAGPVGVGTRDLCVVRARQIDDWAAAFLARHRGAQGVTVVHLACGLDSRCLRLDWAGPGVRWYDVDLPDVVALRRRLVPAPARGDYRLVAADVRADGWLRDLPADAAERPALVVMEGLTPYFTEAEGRRLLARLAARFPAGGQILCDGVGPAMRRFGGLLGITRATGAVFRWGIADPRALEALHPRLVLRDCVRPAELDHALRTFVWPHRLFMTACARLPPLDNLIFYLRFDF